MTSPAPSRGGDRLTKTISRKQEETHWQTPIITKTSWNWVSCCSQKGRGPSLHLARGGPSSHLTCEERKACPGPPLASLPGLSLSLGPLLYRHHSPVQVPAGAHNCQRPASSVGKRQCHRPPGDSGTWGCSGTVNLRIYGATMIKRPLHFSTAERMFHDNPSGVLRPALPLRPYLKMAFYVELGSKTLLLGGGWSTKKRQQQQKNKILPNARAGQT